MALAIGAAVAIGLVVPVAILKWVIAALLVGLGGYRLLRSRHIAYGGMQVNSAELATWSFLMATAHGAGLMVLPLVMSDIRPSGHVQQMSASMLGGGVECTGVSAALVHTAGYLLVTGLIAVIVYEKVGLRFLRTAWLNLDLIWAAALVITGVATLML
jgi:hypothetical protein